MFNTVQTQLEALYHFYKPSSVEEANSWLWNYLAHYNSLPHRYEKHSRLEDWQQRICLQKVIDKCVIGKNFAKWHENQTKRKVSSDACITLNWSTLSTYPEMAGEK